MINTTLNNRYRLDEELGQGGMGIVYRGHDTLLGRDVAVKVLSKQVLGKGGETRLINEARAVAQLDHPNIVSIYDAGIEDEVPYIVMQYVVGKTFEEEPPEGIEKIVELTLQLCRALEHAHEKGIVHRDINPSNVIQTPGGVVRLMDFSIARLPVSDLTLEGAMLGTARFIAPEQAMGRKIDLRADLYSLGAMLYMLTTGQPPFQADDLLGMVTQHIHAPLTPPSEIISQFPKEINDMIVWLMQKDPADRPDSAVEVRGILTRWLRKKDGDGSAESEITEELTFFPETAQPLELGKLPVQLTSFVGREEEIDQFTRMLALTATGQGQMVLIAGEPGIGKSRLVHETTILARQQGFNLLSAHCYQVEQTMPYQPLIDLARQVMMYDDRWQQLAPVWLREMAVLVPEMGEVATAATAFAHLSDELDESQQGRLFQAIFRLFTNQAERKKLLLVAEDIHWADPATLQCLHYLARHIDRVPIALILSFREESLSTNTDLVALLHSFQREAHVTLLPLERLTEADTTTLVAQMAGTAAFADRLGHWLHKETDGNPFFITSLLQSIREDGLMDDSAKTDWQALARTDPNLTLPDAIRDSVLSRLQRLPQAEREALDWMAVHGRPIDFSTLQAISHQPKMTLLNAVEQLYERQLLVETIGQYDFDHNKIREVVYYELSAARRGLYHRQIAETLEVLPLSPAKASILAHHFERGGENEKALAYWMQAGKHALDTYAYHQAARHYERALALTDQPASQMDAYLGLGRAFILLDDHKAATAMIMQGLQLAERYGDDSRRARLLYAQAQNASRQHRPDGGKPEVEAALVAAEKAGDEYYLAQSLLLLTEVHESSGNLSSALETATRAQIVSSKLNDNQLEARALVEIGFLHAQRAEFNEAVSAAERGLNLLAETNDRNAIAYAWNIKGRALGGRGDYSRALDAFHRSQEEAEIISDRYLLAQVFNMQGWLYRELGDYENALKFDKEGVDTSKLWGKPSPEISARLNVCLDMLHLGDPNRALVLLDEIEGQINVGSFGFHNWRWRLRLLHARGLCFMVLDEPAKVLTLAEEGLSLAETNVSRKYVALNHELKGIALAELSKMDEAISELETAISLADATQYQPVRWGGRHQLAKLYRQNGRKQEAKNTSSEAKHIIQTIATALEDENLRATFLNAALPQ